jgi:methionyl-tRNA synthetase
MIRQRKIVGNSEKILVTSALPYANGPLHLGHLAGAYLPGDIYVRFQRLKGRDVVYICGSDEHGVPITIKAEKEGVTPREIIDRYHEMNKRSFARFGMSFDNYSRTSLPIHHETAQEFFLDFYGKGLLKKKTTQQFYDEEAQMFLPDRYVEGTCPVCGSPGARGDQCEKCGSDLNQTDLKDPISKITGRTPVLRDTEHWFFPLGDFQRELQAYLDSHPEWKDNVKNYCNGWFKEGLKDRAVTRDLSWGIKVPLEGADDKVLYVWFEAVLGYISSTKEWAARLGHPDRWKDYWQDENCKLVHFIGKDNIVFHAIMFPAILMAKGEYTLVDNVPANEYLNIEGSKISTSRDYAIWLDEYLEKHPVDPLRYCLASIAPETKDSDFSWKDYQTRNNSELVGILGNFINRSLTFVDKYFENKVPPRGKLDQRDTWMLGQVESAPQRIGSALERFEVRQALRNFMDVCRDANKYFNDKEPWKTVKSDLDACGTTLNICIHVSRTLAVLMEPFLPFSAEKLWQMLRFDGDVHKQSWDTHNAVTIPGRHLLGKPEILFEKIEDTVIEQEVSLLAKKARTPTSGPAEAAKVQVKSNLITFEQFKQIDLRVARILSAERVEKADKLLRLQIDLGDEQRQIVAGIAQHYAPEDLPGRTIIVVANLQPAKIRGLESQGMLLAVENNNGGLTLLSADGDVRIGGSVR